MAKKAKAQTKTQKGGKKLSQGGSGATLDARKVTAPPAKEGKSTAPNMRGKR